MSKQNFDLKNNKQELKVRVRYAPSPTGFLHIGGARTALFNYLFAKHFNGSFILRIEDTDQLRNVKDGIKSQLDNLRWLNIFPDETVDTESKFGPYQQSKRLELYRDYAAKLLKNNRAYYCFCTPEELEKTRKLQIAKHEPPHYSGKCRTLTTSEVKAKFDSGLKSALRFKVESSTEKEYQFNDLVRGDVSFSSLSVDDFVILKNNDYPSYNFANVIDDHLMEISHVIRAEEHLSNTPKQLALYEAFGWNSPIYAHVAMIIGDDHKKLSKRNPNVVQFISQYKDLGYLPEAIDNFLALLGWSPSTEQEIFSLSELVTIFDEKRLTKAPSIFDTQKLQWINHQYIKDMEPAKYLSWIKKFIKHEYQELAKSETWLNTLLLLHQKEINFGQQINEYISWAYQNSTGLNKKLHQLLRSQFKETTAPLVKEVLNQFKEIDDWTEQNIANTFKPIMKTTKIKGKAFYFPLRIIATHSEHGPALAAVLYIIGKNEVISNLENWMNN